MFIVNFSIEKPSADEMEDCIIPSTIQQTNKKSKNKYKLSGKKYYENHIEYYKNYQKEYRKQHKEYFKSYYEQHKTELKKYKQMYYEQHKNKKMIL